MKKTFVQPSMAISKIRTNILCGSGGGGQGEAAVRMDLGISTEERSAIATTESGSRAAEARRCNNMVEY